MLKRLLHNWNLKLTSLALAIVLWSHVRGEVNPWEAATFRVPLSLGAAPGLQVLNKSKLPLYVRVKIRAPRSRLRELKGFAPPNPLAASTDVPLLPGGDIVADIDWTEARPGQRDLPVKASAKADDVEIIGVVPDNVLVQLAPQ